MKGLVGGIEGRQPASWVGWCCSYCSAPLEPRAHGLFCEAENRWFATEMGIHRLLTHDRRREILPFIELYGRIRRDEGWKAERGLPEVDRRHPRAALWRARARRFGSGLQLAAEILGPRPWRVLDVGAGSCWASLRLLDQGHRVVAVDVNMDPEDGLPAANAFLENPERLPRAEAEMDALPIEPGTFDLIFAGASLHYASGISRTLVELRRVTRRGGMMLVLDSPTYRRRQDGEAMVAVRMDQHRRRYGISVSRESQSGYLVYGELEDLFGDAGWRVAIHEWPGPVRELARDILEMSRWGRRTARFPIVVARRDG